MFMVVVVSVILAIDAVVSFLWTITPTLNPSITHLYAQKMLHSTKIKKPM